MAAKGGQTRLRRSTQRILDEVLAAAPEQAKQRFCALLGPAALQSSQARPDQLELYQVAGEEVHRPRHSAPAGPPSRRSSCRYLQ